jgi:hypothetical protein
MVLDTSDHRLDMFVGQMTRGSVEKIHGPAILTSISDEVGGVFRRPKWVMSAAEWAYIPDEQVSPLVVLTTGGKDDGGDSKVFVYEVKPQKATNLLIAATFAENDGARRCIIPFYTFTHWKLRLHRYLEEDFLSQEAVTEGSPALQVELLRLRSTQNPPQLLIIACQYGSFQSWLLYGKYRPALVKSSPLEPIDSILYSAAPDPLERRLRFS